MNFVDKVRVFVKGGKGGDGCLGFRREKFVEFGGPNGADGGKGGDVYLEATDRQSTLLDLTHRPHVTAADGEPGKGWNKTGEGGRDYVVEVPVGTVVYKEGIPVADLSSPGQRYLAARGGRGGRGNLSFKTRHNTAPRIFERGEPGEKVQLGLELKLIADVGLVGLPNAGKSTLLARLTAAKPKIADYPFTTLAPNLGVASHKGVHFVLADIPGLIEGAHEGKGLGLDFLRHIERTRVLVHLIDPGGFSGDAAAEGIRVIEAELKSYKKGLEKKPRILAVNKMDLPEGEAALKKIKARYKTKKVFGISAATGEGLAKLLDLVIRELAQSDRKPIVQPPAGPAAVHVPVGFSIEKLGGGKFRLKGPFVERAAAMLEPSLPEAMARFQAVLKKIGVDRALRRAGVQEGDMVACGALEFEWSDAPARKLHRIRHKRTRIGVGKS